jgi:uncharacterized membrane protein
VTADVDRIGPERSRLLYPGFIASLALNLLFIGVFAAAVWHHRHERPRTGEPGLLGFVKDLPADRQDSVRQEISAAREGMKDLRGSVRQTWLDANSLLASEPFDKEKFKAALAKLADVELRYKTTFNGALAETAASLSPDERKLLKAWREKRRPRLLLKATEESGDDGKM